MRQPETITTGPGRLSDPVSIVGIGDIAQADFGAACYVLDALARIQFNDAVQLFYLGGEPRCAAGYLYGTQLAIIVGVFCFGGKPGTCHHWDYAVFCQHRAWMAAECPMIQALAKTISANSLADGFPETLRFIWIEPGLTNGYRVSAPVRKAIWKTVHTIKKMLVQTALLPDKALSVSSMIIPGAPPW
jgi:Ni,Fe-hydrogenase maturation factor